MEVFEHEIIKVGDGARKIKAHHLKALQQYYGEAGVPYYSLVHNGVKFNEFVGVIQVGDLVIKVLPKINKIENTDWNTVLINMLQSVGLFDTHAPSFSSLHIKSNSILDLYFELFVKEVEYVLRNGLIKKYRKVEANSTALKGSINFSKHIQQNLLHKEKFFVRYTTYDREHELHKILYKCLQLLSRINTNILLQSRIKTLLLDFPEMPDINVNEQIFEKIQYDRKSESYRNSIEIARLLLLNYHPDVQTGQNNVLALMFDMNLLWEQFVYVCLRKYRTGDMKIVSQNSKKFWKSNAGGGSTIRPDIVIKQNERTIVLDTKWKNLSNNKPSPEDLKQMYVYHKYFFATKVALVYPGTVSKIIEGKYYHEETGIEGENACSVIPIPMNQNFIKWQKEISINICNWIESS